MLGIMLPNLCLRRESPLRWAFFASGQSVIVTLCPFCYALIQSIIQTFVFVKGRTGGKRRISLAMFQIFYNVLCNVPRKSLIIKISSNVPNVPSNFVTLETRIARPPLHSASPSSLLILVMEPVIYID
jgi:hypothetical protein